MKSLKSLLAIITVTAFTFACSSVTDADFGANDNNYRGPVIDQTNPTDVLFSDGIDPDPIVVKPPVNE